MLTASDSDMKPQAYISLCIGKCIGLHFHQPFDSQCCYWRADLRSARNPARLQHLSQYTT
jgi:hypothetical protein